MKVVRVTSWIIAWLAGAVLLGSCSMLGNGSSNNEGSGPRNIVFAAQAGEHYQIFSMREDGSGVKQLTSSDKYYATNPVWSPDGTQIAFETSRKAPIDTPNLYVMDSDGSDMHPLFVTAAGEPLVGNNPAWSPDGTKVAYDHCYYCEAGSLNFNIFVLDLKAGTIDTLTHSASGDEYPTWSPDGKRIAFTSDREYVNADSLRFRKDLYVINANGSHIKRITQTGYAREPVWKPEGNTVTFRSTSSSPGIYNVNIASGNIVTLQKDPSRTHLYPNRWSKDGNKLLITAWELDAPRRSYIYILNSEKKELKEIYSETGDNKANSIWIGSDWYGPN